MILMCANSHLLTDCLNLKDVNAILSGSDATVLPYLQDADTQGFTAVLSCEVISIYKSEIEYLIFRLSMHSLPSF